MVLSLEERIELEARRATDRRRFEEDMSRAEAEWRESESLLGPSALSPFMIVGMLSILRPHAQDRETHRIDSALRDYSERLRRAIPEDDPGWFKGLDDGLEYLVGVPEDMVAELKPLDPQQIRRRMSLTEFDSEFFAFLEYTFLAIEGLKVVRPTLDVAPYEERINDVRDAWKSLSSKVAEAYRGVITPERVEAMRASLPSYWWYHTFEDSLRNLG